MFTFACFQTLYKNHTGVTYLQLTFFFICETLQKDFQFLKNKLTIIHRTIMSLNKHHKTNNYQGAWEFLCFPFIGNESSVEKLGID